MSKKNSVSFTKPPEPAFLKAIKEKVGYKEGPTADTKRERLELDCDRDELDDELPTVVVLKKGDLNEQEVETARTTGALDDDADEPADGKIRYRKPRKRQNEDDVAVNDKKKSSSKKVKNKSLLSFNEDDEDG